MSFQYTVTNHRLPARPVVIRTHSRSTVLPWRYMQITPRCLDRVGLGLRRVDERVSKAHQLDFFNRGVYIRRDT